LSIDDTHTFVRIDRPARVLRYFSYVAKCRAHPEQIAGVDGWAQAARDPSVQANTAKEAVMDDRQKDEARTPQPTRYVNDLQLHRVLDESLWQMERQRVTPTGPSDKSS
jgi:hypothetical protein